jgi:hypothetical protein
VKLHFFSLLTLILFSCDNISVPAFSSANTEFIQLAVDASSKYDVKSWQYFLQHLPVIDQPILDYAGKPIRYQQKHVGIIPYDVGSSDLQQCADALMRLRAEYLFQQKRFDAIGFHFVSGDYYTWNDYCKGLRPVAKGSGIKFIQAAASGKTHESLRRYLDILYTYASTISLSKELKTADDFDIEPSLFMREVQVIASSLSMKQLIKKERNFINSRKDILLRNPFMCYAI